MGDQAVLTERFSGRRTTIGTHAVLDLVAQWHVSQGLDLYTRLGNLLPVAAQNEERYKVLLLADPTQDVRSWKHVEYIFQRDYWWPWVVSGLYRPITSLTYWIDYAMLTPRPDRTDAQGTVVREEIFHAAGATTDRAIELATVHEGRASLSTAIINSLGFGVLMLSEYKPTAWFGGLLGLTMAVAFLAEVFILPATITLLPSMFGADALRRTRSRAAAA